MLVERAGGVEVSFRRAITVFRVASLGYAVLLLVGADGYQRPLAGWALVTVMAAWTTVSTVLYARRPGPLLLGADLVITVACLLASRLAQGAVESATPLTATWVAGPVLAWAVHGGRRTGVIAALVVTAGDVLVRGLGAPPPLNTAVLLLLTGLVVGHVSRLAREAEQRLDRAARAEAAGRERERLARGIHDSVLQVLALVQRRGLELGGEAAELGRLAGEQEVALRRLVHGPADTDPGVTDLGEALRRHERTHVTVSTAGPLLVPTGHAAEITAAVGAALDNVRLHCDPGTHAWVFAESDDRAVTVSVRDEGPGIPDGRLREAAEDGRLGVAQSIVGRIADLGGTVDIVSTAGQGTEVELRVPLRRKEERRRRDR
ncbi:MAG TPA: DUF5931 domain-containing protein [Pseudonocardiaceae bacterium]